MASTRFAPGPATTVAMQRLMKPPVTILGQPPQTLNMPAFDTPQEAFVMPSRRTPQGQRLLGHRRKGGRILASLTILVCIGGIAAEIACILAAGSGAQQARKLSWPLAETPAVWKGCGYLPNRSDQGKPCYVAYFALNNSSLNISDAPATSYGATVAVLYHSMNVGIFLMLFGLISFWFGFPYFKKAAHKAFVPLHILRALAEKEQRELQERTEKEAAKRESKKDPLIWRGTVEQAMKQLQAYRPAEG
ncbi:hypothetical protein P389DRAFT_193975 [Cystobasidium minutum MCA 4210]|uniref:uncharacterized protein n=1 Tax=Cystobasidium minutum MCA 4210 TaxID=1397322 RepID=UPI0034D00B81|eukprot:jgi/Rhomi1/193975/gm1.2189_g